MVTLDQGQWPQIISTKGNALGRNPIAANANYVIFFECCISFWEECMWVEPWVIFHSYSGPLSKWQNTPLSDGNLNVMFFSKIFRDPPD